jgi:uncharacterized protein
MGTTEVLPLFPLNTVLFPEGPLSLRIFETRYVDMVGRCMRAGSPFGVLRIKSGAEVGPVAELVSVGVTARIVDFGTLSDGLLGIVCVGERKFHVERHWIEHDGLHMGEVTYPLAEPPTTVPEEHRWLTQLLSSLLPQLQELYPGLSPRLEDGTWVGYRLAEVLPIGVDERLALLELSDPQARLKRLAHLARMSQA